MRSWLLHSKIHFTTKTWYISAFFFSKCGLAHPAHGESKTTNLTLTSKEMVRDYSERPKKTILHRTDSAEFEQPATNQQLFAKTLDANRRFERRQLRDNIIWGNERSKTTWCKLTDELNSTEWTLRGNKQETRNENVIEIPLSQQKPVFLCSAAESNSYLKNKTSKQYTIPNTVVFIYLKL